MEDLSNLKMYTILNISTKNLLSWIRLAKSGYVCKISNQNVETSLYLRFGFNKKKENKNLVGKFIADELNIVRIPIKLVNRQIDTIYTNNDKLTDYSKQIWHQRLGHFYHEDLVNYLNLHNVKEIECMDCKISKLKRRPHNGKTPKASGILEAVHSDLMGLINKSVTGKSYILTFLDEYSREILDLPCRKEI